MKMIVKRSEMEHLAEATGKTVEQLVNELGLLEYEILIRQGENQKIIDRINKRLQGVQVAPAWVEALRRK